MTKRQAYPVYLIMSAVLAFLTSMSWIVKPVYYVLTVHMNPLQLVLIGTVLEVSYFLFQVPTGLFADARSRRLSIIIGLLLEGAGLLVQGLVPVFGAIILLEAGRGLGAAFRDGAEEAWLSDELGPERFGQSLVRGSQVGQVAGIVGTITGVALASLRLNLPIVLGGLLFLPFAIFLVIVMPERGFRPARHVGRIGRQVMAGALWKSVRLIRGSSVLFLVLAIGVIFGSFSEGFDRLWQAHFLIDFRLPSPDHLRPVAWFGVFTIGPALLSLPAMEIVRRYVDLNSHIAVARALFAVNAVLIVSVVTFGLAASFALAVGAFFLASVMRGIQSPVYTAWLNQSVTDSDIRATVLSLCMQADSVGQFAGGPIIGVIGTIFSLRAAVTAAGAALTAALPLYAWAIRRGGDVPVVTADLRATAP